MNYVKEEQGSPKWVERIGMGWNFGQGRSKEVLCIN